MTKRVRRLGEVRLENRETGYASFPLFRGVQVSVHLFESRFFQSYLFSFKAFFDLLESVMELLVCAFERYLRVNLEFTC